MRCSSLSIKALFVPDGSMRYRDTDGVMDCKCKSTTCGLTEQGVESHAEGYLLDKTLPMSKDVSKVGPTYLVETSPIRGP